MNCSDRRMPPSPSVIVWCIFCTQGRPAARRARRRARTPTAGGCGRAGPARTGRPGRTAGARCPGSGRARWRTWRSMSKSGSSCHSGGAMRPSAGTTRWCRRGIRSTACSIRRRNRPRSGLESSIVTLPKFELRYGSLSTFHSSASRSDMRSPPSRSRVGALERPSSWGRSAAGSAIHPARVGDRSRPRQGPTRGRVSG